MRRERELRELPGQVAVARAALEATETRRATLAANAHALAERLREHEVALREAQRQLETARAMLETATQRLAQTEQERVWATGRREALTRDTQALAAQHAETATRLVAAESAARTAEARLGELRAHEAVAAQATRTAQAQLSTLRAASATAAGQVRASRSLLAAHAQTLALVARQEEERDQAYAALNDERATLAAAHAEAEALHHALLAELEALRSRLVPAETALHTEEAQLAILEQHEGHVTTTLLACEAAQGRASLEAQRAADRQEALLERARADGVELTDEPDAPQPTTPDAAPAELQPELDALKTKLLRLGAVNPLALEEYEEVAERRRFLDGQLADLREAGATLLELIDELDQVMHSRFQATFHAVAAEFEQSFTRLFGGGTAKLVLTGAAPANSDEARAGATGKGQGVEIIARPPGKQPQNIALLSGGERTLTAAALLFAILKVNPSPFCILDETDAALDESNVGRFRDALAYLTDETQFILITHNRGTIEAADTLYGVTMGEDGASKLMSLRVAAYVVGEV